MTDESEELIIVIDSKSFSHQLCILNLIRFGSAQLCSNQLYFTIQYDSVLAIRKQALREYCLLAGSIMGRAIQGMSLLRDNYKEYENTGELRRSGRRVFIQYLLWSRYVLCVWIPA